MVIYYFELSERHANKNITVYCLSPIYLLSLFRKGNIHWINSLLWNILFIPSCFISYGQTWKVYSYDGT